MGPPALYWACHNEEKAAWPLPLYLCHSTIECLKIVYRSHVFVWNCLPLIFCVCIPQSCWGPLVASPTVWFTVVFQGALLASALGRSCRWGSHWWVLHPMVATYRMDLRWHGGQHRPSRVQTVGQPFCAPCPTQATPYFSFL